MLRILSGTSSTDPLRFQPGSPRNGTILRRATIHSAMGLHSLTRLAMSPNKRAPWPTHQKHECCSYSTENLMTSTSIAFLLLSVNLSLGLPAFYLSWVRYVVTYASCLFLLASFVVHFELEQDPTYLIWLTWMMYDKHTRSSMRSFLSKIVDGEWAARAWRPRQCFGFQVIHVASCSAYPRHLLLKSDLGLCTRGSLAIYMCNAGGRVAVSRGWNKCLCWRNPVTCRLPRVGEA